MLTRRLVMKSTIVARGKNPFIAIYMNCSSADKHSRIIEVASITLKAQNCYYLKVKELQKKFELKEQKGRLRKLWSHVKEGILIVSNRCYLHVS